MNQQCDSVGNPFGKEKETLMKPKEKYFWIKLSSWNWALTEDITSDEVNPYYDFGIGGTFLDTETNCPFCGEQESIFVRYGSVGFNKNPPFQATEWCCNACGLCGQVKGAYGLGEINSLPSTAPPLPDEICISDENKPKSSADCYKMDCFSPPAYIVISDGDCG